MKWRTLGNLVWQIYLIVVLVAFVIPLIVVVLSSFTESAAISFPPGSLTLDNYTNIPQSYLNSILISFAVALGVVGVVAAIGLPASYALVRGKIPGSEAIDNFIMSPQMLPGSVAAIAIYRTYVLFYNLHNTYWGLVLAQAVTLLPFMIRPVSAALHGFDPTLEESARCLGAGRLRTFALVTLPVVGPSVIAGVFTTFIISLGEFTITFFVTGVDYITIPIRMYTDIEWKGITPETAAISSLLIYVAVAIMFVVQKFVGSKYLTGAKL